MRAFIKIVETAQQIPGRLYYSGDPSERETIMMRGLDAGAFFTAEPQQMPGSDIYKVGMARAQLSPVEGGWTNDSRIDQGAFVMLKDYGHDPSLVETDEFKRWFRGSRVIDGDSNPAVVHHFTQMDFEEFDDTWAQKRFGRSPDRFDAIGVWFTDNDGARYGTKRMDCYLRIRRPFWMDDIPGIGQDGECGYQLLKMMNEAGGAIALRKRLMEQGHDGIIMTGTKLDMWEQNVFIVFNSNQVKSVRNRGTFDKRSNNIMEARATRPPLPAPGQKPWWVEPLAKMTAELSDFENWTWTTGGCFAFADRFQKAYGGQLWGACTYTEADEMWDVQHAVVKIGDTFYDFNGVFDPVSYRARLMNTDFATHEYAMKPKRSVWWPEDDFLNDAQWAGLLKVLKTGQPYLGS